MLWNAALLLTSACDCWGWKTCWLNFTSFAVAGKRWRWWREQEEEAFLSNSFVPPLTLLPFPVNPHVSQKKVYVWKCCLPSNVLSCMKVKRRSPHPHPHLHPPPWVSSKDDSRKNNNIKEVFGPCGSAGPPALHPPVMCVERQRSWCLPWNWDLKGVWFFFQRGHFPGIIKVQKERRNMLITVWEVGGVHVHVPGADNHTESWQDDQDSNYHYKSRQIQRPQMDILISATLWTMDAHHNQEVKVKFSKSRNTWI